MSILKKYDIIVVGGGSAGFGAAISAAREGRRVALLERDPVLGGNVVQAGVITWEPAAATTGLPLEIYHRLLKRGPEAVGIYHGTEHFMACENGLKDIHGGKNTIDRRRGYRDTITRYLDPKEAHMSFMDRVESVLNGVVPDPDHYVAVLQEMIDECENLDLILNAKIVSLDQHDDHLTGLHLESGEALEAEVFIDASSAALSQMAGCRCFQGQESCEVYQESAAPLEPNNNVNGVTLLFRVSPKSERGVDPLPEGIPEVCWWKTWNKGFPVVVMNEYPNGDYNMNMLPTMDGKALLDMSEEEVYEECHRRVLATWHFLQQNFDDWKGYELTWVAPRLGIRDLYRVEADYMMRQQDLELGYSGRRYEDVICLADHDFDTHGDSPLGGPVSEPYGVSYRSLLAKGKNNLLIAGRSAGFSAIAASSCRVSRVMMQMGEAAGLAAHLAVTGKSSIRDIPMDALFDLLDKHHVQRVWPTPNFIEEHTDRMLQEEKLEVFA